MLTTIFYVILGVFSGMVSGMTGASGVMIIIPVLTALFGFPLYAAIGTSLLVDVITSIPIAATYYYNKNLVLEAGIWLSLGGILGAQVGVDTSQLFPDDLVLIAFSIAMIVLGFKFWREGVRREFNDISWKMPWWLEKMPLKITLMLIIGFLLGILMGLFGAGGGIIYFMVLYYLFRIPLKASIGTAAFAMIASSISGSWGHWQQGTLDIHSGLVIGISAAVGGLIASLLANKIDEGLLSKSLSVIFITLAVVMLGVRIL